MTFGVPARSSMWPSMAPKILYRSAGVLDPAASSVFRISTAGFAAVRIVTESSLGAWPADQRVGIDLTWNPSTAAVPLDVPAIKAGITRGTSASTFVVDEHTTADCVFPVLGDELQLSCHPWPFQTVTPFTISVHGFPTDYQARFWRAGQVLAAFGDPIGTYPAGLTILPLPIVVNERVTVIIASDSARWTASASGRSEAAASTVVFGFGFGLGGGPISGTLMTSTVTCQLIPVPLTLYVSNLDVAARFYTTIVVDPR